MRSLAKLRSDLEQQVNDLFNDVWGDLSTVDFNNQPEYVVIAGDSYPKANIQTYVDNGKKHAFIEVAVPGLDEKNIEISLENNTLSIRGEKVEVQPRQRGLDKNSGFVKLNELHKRAFFRQFNFDSLFEIDEKRIDITHNNGMLFIIVPAKSPEAKEPNRKVLDWWKTKKVEEKK